jgi:hypothetical protein
VKEVLSMSDPLVTYLHDHWAGSKFAVELLESLRDRHAGDPLGAFAANILVEVEEDREVLQKVIEKVGSGHPDLKEAAAWLAEKISRFKLRAEPPGGLGTFEALETLSLGLLGKGALWKALSVICKVDERVCGFAYDQLHARAHHQHDQVEKYRL